MANRLGSAATILFVTLHFFLNPLNWATAGVIEVYDMAPYSGQIVTRGLPGFSTTFGYKFEGTALYAEFLVRDDKTLQQAINSRGFNHINWLQIVTQYPGGPLSGCLGNAPFIDPQLGGCLLPYIKADFLPFYYDVGNDFENTEYFIGKQTIFGYDIEINDSVGVGVSFSDQPASPFASTSSPMKFLLFPVGVFEDGSFESLSIEALSWSSTNNVFFGGEVGCPCPTRTHAQYDGLSSSFVATASVSFTEISQEEATLLRQAKFLGEIPSIQAPEPPSIFIVMMFMFIFYRMISTS